MVSDIIIQCPKCFALNEVKFCDIANTITYECGKCKKEFTNHEALPLNEEKRDSL